MQFLHTCVNLNIMSQATLSLQATHSWHHGVLYLLVSLVQAEGRDREGPEAISGRCLEAPQLSRNNCAASESFLRASAFPIHKMENSRQAKKESARSGRAGRKTESRTLISSRALVQPRRTPGLWLLMKSSCP